MPAKKKEELGETPPQPEAAPEQEAEDKPPTPEELQNQIEELRDNSRKLEENWKNEQRVSSKKEQELQRYRERLESSEDQQDILRALTAVVAQMQKQPTDEFEGELKQNQPDLLKSFEQISKNSRKEREMARMTERVKSVQADTESLGLKEGDDDYDYIKAMAESGKFDKAEARINKIREAKQVTPTEDTPKETEDERIERLATEKARAMLGDKLKQDSGGPSAGTMSKQEAMQKYISGDMTAADAEKYGVTFG